MSDFGWPRLGFLSAIGLEPPPSAEGALPGKLCDAMEAVKDKNALAEAIAAVLGVREKDIYDSKNQSFDLSSFEFRVSNLYDEAVSKLISPTAKAAVKGAFNAVLHRLNAAKLTDKEIDNKKWFLHSMRKVEAKFASGYPMVEDKFAAFLQEVQEHSPAGTHPLKTYKSPYRDAIEQKILAFDGGADGFVDVLKQKMGKKYPSVLHQSLLRPVLLAEAGIDRRTGGAVAVTTKAELDGKDGVNSIKTYYWHMLPSGQQLSQKLFEIEFEPGWANVRTADGKQTVKTPTIVPLAVRVLGNSVYNAADAKEGMEDSAGLMPNLNLIMGALGEINFQLREGKLPEVAKIFSPEEYDLQAATGHNLTITGLSPLGGFDFDAAYTGEARGGKLTVPATVAKALMGFGVNTLDEHQRLRRPEIAKQGFDRDTGDAFMIKAGANEGDNPCVSTSFTPTSLSESKPARALTHVAWKSDGKGQSTLKEIDFLNENLMSDSHLMQMQALGATGGIMHDLRKRYPSAKDYVVEHNLHHLVNPFEPPPPLAKEGGRLTMISVGGNNMEEMVEGFGETIGGNSKVIYHEGLDKNGKLDRVGVIVDLGLHLSPKDEANIYAAPNVIKHLQHCKDILITHRHLDHTDGLFAYMQYGMLKGKTVHATPEVIRDLENKLSTFPSIHPDDRPTFSPLKGQGWLHIKKDDKIRLSVNYARNATPHSARCTPFFVHGHYEGKWIGSYLNPGDARYGRHNGEGYKGPPVDADPLKKEFFTQSNQRLLEESKRLGLGIDPKIAKLGPTYADFDITSIRREDWAPTETEVEKNLVEVANLFKDKGILLSMISTNDTRFETSLRMATRSNRDLTEFGTNLQKTSTTMNVLGVNDQRLKPEERNNIQLYLDYYFEGRIWKRLHESKMDKLHNALNAPDVSNAHRQAIIKQLGAAYPDEPLPDNLLTNKNNLSRFIQGKHLLADDPIQEFLDSIQPGLANGHPLKARMSKEIEGRKEKTSAEEKRELEIEKARLKAFQGLKTMPNKWDRYHARDQMERELGKQFKQKVTLGSIRVGRNSKTAREIMMRPDHDWRRLALLTGTQGTNVEIDAALSALAEGRSLMDGSTENSHTARPVDPKNNVIVISQTAIPGNERKQIDLVNKLTTRGFTVVQALHDGFQIHNIDKKRREAITASLKKCKEMNGTLVVAGMPIHASGHGYHEDCRAWAEMVRAEYSAPQHTADPQAVKRFGDLCDAAGLNHMERIVPNFEGISIKAGHKPKSIGHALPSLILVEIVRQKGTYHSGHFEATELVNLNGAKQRSDGMFGKPGGVYEFSIATRDAEQAARDRAARNPGRPEPIEQNRQSPPEPDLYYIETPGEAFRHRYRKQRQDRKSAALVGR